ncbi:MAG: hypothetical protein E6K82_27975 [Candidatus Rokuibacteriota bacterium]|nr:MAG: hypothetical protein E6K82_27975 [Candidatus Rokubacteria bacterium]
MITCEVAQAAAVALALGSLGGWLGRDGILALVAILGAIALVRDVQPGRVPEELTPASLFSGIAFILRHRLLLGLMSLDLFAVLLGGAWPRCSVRCPPCSSAAWERSRSSPCGRTASPSCAVSVWRRIRATA